MSQFPPAYSDTPEVQPTAPPLESDLVPSDTEQLLEGCPPLPVTHQPQDRQAPIQQGDSRTQRNIPLPPWDQDYTWNAPVTTRVSLPAKQTPDEIICDFATKPVYFEVILGLACLSMCCSFPIGICAFCVALCAYSEFSDKRYNSALALSWVALALGVASVILGLASAIMFYFISIRQSSLSVRVVQCGY